MNRKEIIDLKSEMDQEASVWLRRCQEVARLFYPQKSNVVREGANNSGSERDVRLVDSTGIYSRRLLATTIHGTMSSPSIRWFRLRQRGVENVSEEIKRWMQGYEDVLFDMFAETNFYPESLEFYSDLVAFGSAVMAIEERYSALRGANEPVFRAIDPRSFRFREDAYGVVNELIRVIPVTITRLIARWPKAEESKSIQKRKQEHGGDKVNVLCHCGPEGKRYKTTYVLEEDEEDIILAEEWTDYLIYNVMRWEKETDSCYGNCPAFDAYPDAETLNIAVAKQLESYEKVIDPPFLMGDGNVTGGKVNYLPAGGTEVIDVNDFRLINENFRVDVAKALMEDLRMQIKMAFYVDQIQMPGAQDGRAAYMKTGTSEIWSQRTQWLLSPVFGRFQYEHLRPLIDKVCAMLRKWDYFSELGVPPEGLGNIDIEYVGPMRSAQEMPRITANQRIVELAVQLSQVPEESIPILDKDAYIREHADATGASLKFLRSKEEVQTLRQQYAQERQQQAMAQNAQSMGAGMKSGAEAMNIG